MTLTSRTVAAHLAREVADGRMSFDAAQQAAAVRLDRLGAALHERQRGSRLGRGLRWLRRYASTRAPHGVYLWGGVGRGKTQLMDLFYETLDFPERERQHFYLLMRSVHRQLATLQRRTRPLDIVAARLAAHARVVCLDEFFVADIGDAMILAGLLEGLIRRGVALVATSNLRPQELYKNGLQRQRFLPAIDLIESHLDVVHLNGPVDYRLRELERAHIYFDSARPDAHAQLDRLFGALTRGAAGGPASILIEGRAVRAVKIAPGLAWFEFRELCESARSANDYLELARLYHTIFVANVPLLTRRSEDAARRFLMLIDALYDRGVNVVVSAAAAPASLYQGEKLPFEFDRAASRLIEMQSPRYLAAEHRP